jgi:hypothetical protein
MDLIKLPHWGLCVNADHLTEWLYHCLAQIYSTTVINHIYSEVMWIWVIFGIVTTKNADVSLL